MDSKIEIRDHGICNHIKRDISLSFLGIDLFFVVVEGSANRFGTVTTRNMSTCDLLSVTLKELVIDL